MKPALPEVIPMADDVPNPFGYAVMGILQAKLLEVRSQFPNVRLKTMFVCESEDNQAHTQFYFVNLERMGEQVPYISMTEYDKSGVPGTWRFFDLWLHKANVEELFVEAVDEELYTAANTIWAHLAPK
jgi:hypothetical protein